MKAIEAFDSVLKRARGLIDVHVTLHPKGKPAERSDDVLRAALVLGIAGADAFFHDKIAESIAPLIRKSQGRNLPGALTAVFEKQLSTPRMLEIMFEERRLSHLSTAVRRAIKDSTYQDPGKIEQALRLLGVDDLWHRMASRLPLKGAKAKEKAKTYIQPYVTRRHGIVHEGDLGKGRKDLHRLKRITRAYVREALGRIERFVHAANAVIDNRLQ
jgi:hypothetical protein